VIFLTKLFGFRSSLYETER